MAQVCGAVLRYMHMFQLSILIASGLVVVSVAVVPAVVVAAAVTKRRLCPHLVQALCECEHGSVCMRVWLCVHAGMALPADFLSKSKLYLA